MPTRTTLHQFLDPQARAFYVHTLETLNASGLPYLVGGAYAFARYTGIERHTKDLDLFVRPEDARRALDVLGQAGYQTDMTFPHWLGKAFHGEDFIDVIFSAGNNVARVDDRWFEFSTSDEVLGVPVRLIPPEEMLWSKGYIMERERFDGADIAHVLRACADRLDWDRLLERFDAHWQVLLAHLVLFDFIYPGERRRIPTWVTARLTARLAAGAASRDPAPKLCQGTLLSRQQYLTDIGHWQYDDARLVQGHMAPEDIAHWTAAIEAAH
ncbi:MAG: nucleotidyltransferase [Nannocystis sp.]|nr:nucleotidyltransferase [Nannocystis sp.]MBA3545704.1 nucleotidyltransferase [Nannocystis sp.]